MGKSIFHRKRNRMELLQLGKSTRKCGRGRHSVCPIFATPGLQPPRLLCPWDSPGKNTRGGCHFLLQGIFPNQGSTCLSCNAGRSATAVTIREAQRLNTFPLKLGGKRQNVQSTYSLNIVLKVFANAIK